MTTVADVLDDMLPWHMIVPAGMKVEDVELRPGSVIRLSPGVRPMFLRAVVPLWLVALGAVEATP